MLFILERDNKLKGFHMFDLKALQKAIVKNMLRVADNAQNLKRGDTESAIQDAIKQLEEDCKKEDPLHDIDMNNIDWSKVKVIKENE